MYVIESSADPSQYYIGVTSDLPGRLAAHNRGQSWHTRKYRPWRLVVAIGFEIQDRAFQFEKYLKSHSGRAFVAKHFR